MFDDNLDTSDNDLSDYAFVEAYKTMHLKWTEEYQVVEKHTKIIEALIQDKTRIMLTISELKEEVDHLNSKHDGIT